MKTPYNADYVRGFDGRDSASGAEFTLFGRLYQQRLRAMVRALHDFPLGSRIADLGCAQGNLTLLLAEAGYRVTGIEVNRDFLEYARQKDSRGLVEWICTDLMELPGDHRYDAVMMGELVEHTGAPERLVETAASMLRPGGVLVLTTPNGERIPGERLPSFSEWASAHPDRSSQLYLGPAGEHHVFLFRRGELCALLGPWFSQIELLPLGTAILNRKTEPLLRSGLGRSLIGTAETIVRAVPGLGPLVTNGWLVRAVRAKAPRAFARADCGEAMPLPPCS